MVGGGNTDGKPDESGSLALVLGMIGACYVATGASVAVAVSKQPDSKCAIL